MAASPNSRILKQSTFPYNDSDNTFSGGMCRSHQQQVFLPKVPMDYSTFYKKDGLLCVYLNFYSLVYSTCFTK